MTDTTSVVHFTYVGFSHTFWQLSMAFVIAGVLALAVAVFNERRMQLHRQPGVSYRDVTLRWDGAWRRADLFDEKGLVLQRRAAKWAMTAALCFIAAVIAWVLSNVVP